MEPLDTKTIDFKKYNLNKLGTKIPMLSDGKVSEDSDKVYHDAPNDILLLQRACNYWNGLSDCRSRRRRNRRYYRGDQWGDKVIDPDTDELITEEELIKRHGKVPLKQNQIRQLLKNIIGQYLTDINKTAVVAHKRSDQAVSEMLTSTIQYGLQVNRAREIDTRNFEEFMLSGTAFWKSTYKFLDKFQREDLWISTESLNNMFFSPNIRDIRLTDMGLIGQFYDVDLNDVIAAFAKSPDDEERVRRLFAYVIDPKQAVASTSGDSLSSYYADNENFYSPNEPDKCRVFEVWDRRGGWRLRCHDWLKARDLVANLSDKASIDKENMLRLSLATAQGADPKTVPLITYTERWQNYWYVTYMNMYGDVIYGAESPYDHKEHPYTSLLYPLVDGEVWGFVEDIIDQQRYVNRLVTLLDFIVGSSAKGVLLVPEDSISADFDLDRIAEEWTKFNGVIKIKLKPGAVPPTQVSANSTNVGIHELLNLQLKFMGDISGVSNAIQGQQANSGAPASLYAQETQNSTLNSRDYFEAYGAARTERDWKALKVQIQFYDDERTLALSGSNYSPESLVFRKERADNVQFDMVMAKTPDSPVYRALVEKSLESYWLNNAIDFKTFLKHSSQPFSDSLLNDVIANEKKMQEAANAGGLVTPGSAPLVDQNMVGKVGDYLKAQGADATKADPRAMALMDKYLQGLNNLN